MIKRRIYSTVAFAALSICSIGIGVTAAGASPQGQSWRAHSESGAAVARAPHAVVAPLNMSTLTVSDDATGNITLSDSSPGSVTINPVCGAVPPGLCLSFGGGGRIMMSGPLEAGTSYSSNSNIIVIGTGNASCGTDAGGEADVQLDQFTTQGSPQAISTVALQFACDNGTDTITGTAAYNILPTTPGEGYYLYGDDGSLAGFGNDSYLNYLGDLTQTNLNAPIKGMDITPDGAGYWMTASDGGIFAYGDAGFYGSHGGSHLNQPIVGMTSTPTGLGYWLVASDGGIFAYGDAGFYGSHGGSHLNQPIVGMTSTPTGLGYWLVASDGGIFTYGDAGFYGSHGGSHLNQPIVGMTSTPSGLGYWLVASDGGIFTYGDAGFYGSHGGSHLNQPIVGMTSTPSGLGYWLVASDGGLFTYGDAPFDGSLGSDGITNAIGVATSPLPG